MAVSESGCQSLTETEVEASGPMFEPPLSKQRYAKVRDILQDENIKTVADFGCGEGKFLWYLKNSTSIQDVAAIDIQESILYRAGKMASPLTWDYLFKRDNPLRISIYKGSIAEKDSRMQMYEAVTGIELIEHLEDAILSKLPEVVFDFLRPRVVIFTTPNSEFNVLFPNAKGFRHWDHKFEWTRKELQDWSEEVLLKYPFYTVSYDGVGDPPEESSHLGTCTQIAIFKLKDGSEKQVLQTSAKQHLSYELIKEYKHPSKEDKQA